MCAVCDANDLRTDWSPWNVAELYVYPYGGTEDTMVILRFMMDFFAWDGE